MPVTRPRSVRLLPLPIALTLGLTLSACGSTGSSNAAGSNAGSSGAANTKSAGAGASSGEATGPVTITDAQGKSVKVPANPGKVVVLDWSVARSLTQLGIPIAALPKANGALPADLTSLTKTKTVGTLFEPDYEAIAELEPDLVIIGGRSGNAKVRGEMTKITPNVIDMSVRTDDPAKRLSVVSSRYEQLASIWGKQDAAKTNLAAMNKSIAGVQSKAKQAGGTTMFVQVSGSKVGAYGPGSRFGSVWTTFGFTPVNAPFKSDGGHGEEINQEFFLKYNPSRILVLDRGRTIGETGKPALDVLNNGLVNKTDAASNNKIVPVDGFSWYLAADTPLSYIQSANDLTKAL